MSESFEQSLPESAGPFRTALARGALVLPRCRDCGRVHYYPRHLCPHCHSDRLGWEEIAPEGEAFSVTTYRRGPTPMALAYLAHREDLLILARVTGEIPEIGDRIVLVETDGSTPVVKRITERAP